MRCKAHCHYQITVMEKYTYDKLPKVEGVVMDGDIRSEYPHSLFTFLKNAVWDNLFTFPLANLLYLVFIVLSFLYAFYSGRYEYILKAVILVSVLKGKFYYANVRLYRSFKRAGVFPVMTREGVLHMYTSHHSGKRYVRLFMTPWSSVHSLRVYKTFMTLKVKKGVRGNEEMEVLYLWSNDIKALRDKVLYTWNHAICDEPLPVLYGYDEVETLSSYISERFGEYETLLHEDMVDPGDVHIDVAIIPPAEERDYYTLCTIGAGAYRTDVDKDARQKNLKSEYLEYMLYLPADWELDEESLGDECNYWPIRCLKNAARLPLWTGQWVDAGGAIVAGDDDSIADSNPYRNTLMLYPEPPFTCGTVLCNLPSGKTVVFRHIVPITDEELAYKKEHGLYKLLEQMFPEECDAVEVLLDRMDSTREEC